jgi:hypothetical protein
MVTIRQELESRRRDKNRDIKASSMTVSL